MSKDKRHSATTYKEFKAYLENKLDLKTKHAFEKKVLEDDFESEAMEGMESLDKTALERDISELSKKIVYRAKKRPYRNWQLAAIIILFVSATISIFYVLQPEKGFDVTQKMETPEKEDGKTEEIKPLAIEKDEIKEAAKKETESISQTQNQSLTSGPKEEAEKSPTLSESTTMEIEGELSEELPTESMGENAIAEPVEKRAIDIPDASSIKETELEPLPETGNLNRVATADVLPADDEKLKNEDVEIPATIAYDEGIKEKPGFVESKRSTGTLGRKKDVSKSSGNYASSQPAERMEVMQTETEVEVKASPTGGLDSYIKYLKTNLTFQIDGDSLTIELMINENGLVEEIKFLDKIDEENQTEIKTLILDGPKWEPAQKNGERIKETVKLVLKTR